MPRHFYGELSCTPEGLAILKQYDIINQLLAAGRGVGASGTTVRSALWSLGHVGSSENGFTALMHADPSFTEWCIENVTENPDFSLRAIYFHVLGLLGRSHKGAAKLLQLHWDSAPRTSSSALALPRHPSVLFNGDMLDLETSQNRALALDESESGTPLIRKKSPSVSVDDRDQSDEEVLHWMTMVSMHYYTPFIMYK